MIAQMEHGGLIEAPVNPKPMTNIYTLGDKGLMVDADSLEEAQALAKPMGYPPEAVKFLHQTIDWVKYYEQLKERMK